MRDYLNDFVGLARAAIEQGTFVKLHLGAYRGEDDLKRVVIRPVTLRAGRMLAVQFQFKRKDTHQNIDEADLEKLLRQQVGKSFFQATLFSTRADVTLELQNGSGKLRESPASFNETLPDAHDREKQRCVAVTAPFLRELGIVGAEGKVRPQKYDKYRQIDKFAEILLSVLPPGLKPKAERLCLVDYGSGKNYLTFAAHFLLHERFGPALDVVGVERRAELAQEGQRIAQRLGCQGLRFLAGDVLAHGTLKPDIVIALHACDTATDDALFSAVRAEASLIVVAPCCHKYVRPLIEVAGPYSGLLKHGILEERFATILTDGLRALALEACGYQTKVFEFISSEHTAKNVMITAQQGNTSAQRANARTQLRELCSLWGLKDFYFDRLLMQQGLL